MNLARETKGADSRCKVRYKIGSQSSPKKGKDHCLNTSTRIGEDKRCRENAPADLKFSSNARCKSGNRPCCGQYFKLPVLPGPSTPRAAKILRVVVC